MKKRDWFLSLGILMILSGSMIYLMNSPRRIRLQIDGNLSKIRTRCISVSDILDEAGIPYSDSDRIFPRPNYWMTEDYVLRVDHLSNIELKQSNRIRTFTSTENLAGNILLDGKVKLYPGDRLLWNDLEITADYLVGDYSEIKFVLDSLSAFTLIDDYSGVTKTAYSDAFTVGEALQQQNLTIPSGASISPSPETAFVSDMTIQILQPRQLTVKMNGRETSITGSGASVGEALTRGGIPLQGLDYSIPSEDSPVPPDGRITIVRVREEVSITATAVDYDIEWIPDDSKSLDTVEVKKEGQKGLKGTLTRIRYQDGAEASKTTDPEETLVEPVSSVQTYGTQITVKTVTTPDGTFEYWRSVPVYATSYSPCRSGVDSCITGTSSGAKVEKGVIGVSYNWYLLLGGQNVYVPDYGTAVIGDVGKSPTNDNRWIDLAYSDEDFVNRSENTTLYFLTPIPAEIQWVLP